MGVGCKKIVELFCKQTKTWDDPRGIRTPNLRVWNPTRCHCAMESPTVTPHGPWPKGGMGLSTAKLAALSVEPQWRNWTAHQTSNLGVAIRRPDCVSDKQEAMAQRQRVGFQTRRLGVRIPLASFFFIFVRGNQTQNQKKRLPKLGIAPRLPRPQRGVLLLDYFGTTAYGGSGYRSRFSTLRRLYATMYNNPPCASIGTRTRILSLEGINTTLVVWTLAIIIFLSKLT